MSTHTTPGPWKVTEPPSAQDGHLHIVGANGFWVAEVRRGRLERDQLADAQLIAAAPELLEALRNLIFQHDACFRGREEMQAQYYSAHPDRAETYKRARAAIAKAEGGIADGGPGKPHCPDCDGTGRLSSDMQCGKCRGTGEAN